MDRLTEAFGPSKAAMDSMPQADTRAFIDSMEKGQAQADPKLQPIADALRGLLDNRLQQVQSRGKLANFIQDYFPHLWEDPTGKAKAFAAAAARSPMEGGKSFLRQRTLPLFSDGIAAGLEPVTENPVEAAMLRVREMDKFITAHDALEEMKTQGLLKKVPARGALPEGYAKINDSVGTIYAPPNRKGGISIAGFYAAPDAVASVVNNNLSPGLRNDPHFGGLFRGYLGAGNILNQSSLGLSVFHGTTSALNAAVSEFGLGIKDAVEGRPLQGVKRMGFGLSLVGPAARDYWNGSQVLKEWNKPGSFHYARHGKRSNVAGLPPDFPLYAAPDGRWVRNVGGRTYYFGSQKADPRGLCAVKDWEARRPLIKAGLEPRVSMRERKRQRHANCGR